MGELYSSIWVLLWTDWDSVNNVRQAFLIVGADIFFFLFALRWVIRFLAIFFLFLHHVKCIGWALLVRETCMGSIWKNECWAMFGWMALLLLLFVDEERNNDKKTRLLIIWNDFFFLIWTLRICDCKCGDECLGLYLFV